MITEDYVSFETAKLLKEKGFNERLLTFYITDEAKKEGCFQIMAFTDDAIDNNHSELCFIAPTQAMAMKWLREVYNIHTEICLYKTSEDDVEPKKSRKAPYYTFGVWNTVTGDNVDKRLTNDFIGDTYEQACEIAIKYCLEYLI